MQDIQFTEKCIVARTSALLLIYEPQKVLSITRFHTVLSLSQSNTVSEATTAFCHKWIWFLAFKTNKKTNNTIPTQSEWLSDVLVKIWCETENLLHCCFRASFLLEIMSCYFVNTSVDIVHGASKVTKIYLFFLKTEIWCLVHSIIQKKRCRYFDIVYSYRGSTSIKHSKTNPMSVKMVFTLKGK